jgi:hypothetical protein
MNRVMKVIGRDNDPLGYDGSVLERVRAMAQDALAGANEDAVEEEAALIRRCLHLKAAAKERCR